MAKERKQQPDPLEVINWDNEHRRLLKSHVLRSVNIFGLTFGSIGLAELIGVPKQTQVNLGLLSAGTIVYGREFIRSVTNKRFIKGISLEELEKAIDRLKRVGVKEGSVKKMFDSRGGISNEVGEYLLAQRIRATKYYLARRGRLREYEKFKWLDTVPINPKVKPTREDVEEVKEWARNYQERTNNFVNELAKRKNVVIQCGDEINPRTTEVFLFHDPDDFWKHETLPLIDVMRGFAATQDELHDSVSIINAINLYKDPNHYDGIYSPKGRQRIADFFGKTCLFYTGADVGRTSVNRYGVWEPEVAVVDTVVEYLTGLRRDPYSCLETVEPTKAKAEKIGLELATA